MSFEVSERLKPILASVIDFVETEVKPLDDEFLADKKRRDQERLYGMVELASEQIDRKAFLNRYFLGSTEDHS